MFMLFDSITRATTKETSTRTYENKVYTLRRLRRQMKRCYLGNTFGTHAFFKNTEAVDGGVLYTYCVHA